MSGIRTTALASAVRHYCSALAKGYSVEDTAHFFEVTGPKEIQLRNALMLGSEVLTRINMSDVQQITGEAVTVGRDRIATGRVKTGRFAGITPDIYGDTYTLNKTDSVATMSWEQQAAWINAGSQNEFNNKLNSYANEQFSADIVRVGFNGTHCAESTDPETYPNGEDVNEGWHARALRLAPDQVVTVADGGIIYFDPDGTKDADGKPLFSYKTLDSMASDLVNNVLHERFRNAPDLVVLVGRGLISAAQYKLYTEADKPSEQIAAQKLDKSIAGMPAFVPPYFPANRMVVTSWKNLSVYTQKGSRRRKVKDNDDKGCLESFYWRMEGYMIESLEKYAAFDENAVVIGSKDGAPAAPVITAPLVDTSVVVGESANFTVAADNADSFAWSLDGADLGESSDTLVLDTTGKSAGNYTVEVTAMGEGGSAVSSVTLTITPA